MNELEGAVLIDLLAKTVDINLDEIGLFVARGAPAVTIEREICIAKPCVAAVKAPAHQCTDPRQEFRQNKRLGEVIVGTRIEPFNALLDQSSRGKHHHGRLNSSLSQLPADFDSAEIGQTHVEKNRVVRNVRS